MRRIIRIKILMLPIVAIYCNFFHELDLTFFYTYYIIFYKLLIMKSNYLHFKTLKIKVTVFLFAFLLLIILISYKHCNKQDILQICLTIEIYIIFL